MNYTVALTGELSEELYFRDVDWLQTSDASEDYVFWGEGERILAIFPRKEVRYIRVSKD
ncbi:hypothetical protein AB1K09_19925 [Solibacillus silvestris]